MTLIIALLTTLVYATKSKQLPQLCYTRRVNDASTVTSNTRSFNVDYDGASSTLPDNEIGPQLMISDCSQLSNDNSDFDSDYVILFVTQRIPANNAANSLISEAYLYEPLIINGPGWSIAGVAAYADEGSTPDTTVPVVDYTVLGFRGYFETPDVIRIEFDNEGTAEWNDNGAIFGRRVTFVYKNQKKKKNKKKGTKHEMFSFNANQMLGQMETNDENEKSVVHVIRLGQDVWVMLWAMLAIVVLSICVCVYGFGKRKKDGLDCIS